VTWLRAEVAGATPVDRIFGLRPNANARFTELLEALPSGGVDEATLAACRARSEALHEHFTDAQLATLTLAVAMYDALARFTVALEV
jgi:alkylhydroperoxidase family enzyme